MMNQQPTIEEVLLVALTKIAQLQPEGNPAAVIATDVLMRWIEMKGITTVVNINTHEPYDVYIGRPSKWGNPFRLSDYGGDRELCLKVYRHWLCRPAQKALRQAARRELAGKRLGCFCAPQACHGHVLIEVIGQPEKEETADGHCS